MEQMTLDQSTPGISGSKIMEEARKWAKANADAYHRMVGEAKKAAANGKRTSIAKLAEEVRYSMPLKKDECGFKVNNTVRAGLARLMVSEHPELAQVMEMRASKADWA